MAGRQVEISLSYAGERAPGAALIPRMIAFSSGRDRPATTPDPGEPIGLPQPNAPLGQSRPAASRHFFLRLRPKYVQETVRCRVILRLDEIAENRCLRNAFRIN